MKPISAKKFNVMQNQYYTEYCDKCRINGIEPEPQGRYFPTVVNYGFVVYNRFGEIYWKKNKGDFMY